METRFSPSQLADPGIRIADEVLKTCVHYGFCTATCPTYVLSGDENESPRGRIDLIKDMLERGGRPDPKTVQHIDQCLSCLSCMTTCAAKVDYASLVDVARHHIEQHFRRPLADRLVRELIARTLPYSGRSAFLARLGPLARRVKPALPRKMRPILDLMPATPGSAPPRADQMFRTARPRRGAVALLTGCVQRVFEDEINQATVRVLNRIGFDVHVVREAGCCGALPLHMGRAGQALELARDTLRAWADLHRRAPLDAIVINASGCGTAVKDYGKLFADTEMAGQAADVAALTRDISEFLADQPAIDFPNRGKLVVAYHDPCSLQHAQGIVEPPRRLLTDAGFEVRNIPEGHFCCGSAGTYNMLQPRVARELGQRKAAKAESTEPDIIVTGNLGCMIQLRQYAGRPILHTIQLVDWAMGGPDPAGLEALAARAARLPVKSETAAEAGQEQEFW